MNKKILIPVILASRELGELKDLTGNPVYHIDLETNSRYVGLNFGRYHVINDEAGLTALYTRTVSGIKELYLNDE
ncbi:MAG: hypothetical protein ABWW65_01415, partial [Thermoprotei archaeon]